MLEFNEADIEDIKSAIFEIDQVAKNEKNPYIRTDQIRLSERLKMIVRRINSVQESSSSADIDIVTKCNYNN